MQLVKTLLERFVAVSESPASSCGSVSVSAEDGALLGKIEKVRVLRNDRREGEEEFLIFFITVGFFLTVL